MRVAILVCTGLTLPVTGCSAYVAASGKNLGTLTTREQVQAEFGQPVATGTADGKTYEDFRTHRKIAEPWKGIYICMYDVASLGLLELYLLPREVFVAGHRSLRGQTLRFEYDQEGNVTLVRHNGESVPGIPHPRLEPRKEGTTTLNQAAKEPGGGQ